MFLSSSMMITIFLLLLYFLHVSGNVYGPRLLTSHVGGSVTIKCYYLTTSTNRHDRKYWCKESKHSRKCQTLISTSYFIHESYKARVSMTDIPQNGIFLVTMTELEKNDSGSYRCGIGKNNVGLYFGINLSIGEGLNLAKSPEIFWGQVSGSVAILCPSEGNKSSEGKFMCKLRRNDCLPIRELNRKTSRFVFTAQDKSENFHVLINQLRKEDSGMYKCGTGKPNNYASARTLQLQVTEDSVFSNILSFMQTTYQPQTSSPNGVTSANEFYKESSSETELNLLPIIIPVLVLVLAAAITAVFIKIKRQKKYDPNDVDARNPEVAIPLTEQTCPVEEPKQENIDSDEPGCAVGANKETPATNVYCLLGQPKVEESREED